MTPPQPGDPAAMHNLPRATRISGAGRARADRGRREVQRSDQERCHLGASDGIARTVQGPVQSATQGDALVGDGVDVGGVNAGDVAEGADSPKR